MRVETRHAPAFAIARVSLDPGESFKAEAGAMALHSTGVTLQAQMQGGLGGALKRRVLGGESLFITTFTAHPQVAGWVDVTGRLPGDIVLFDVDPSRGLNLTRGSWLASADSVAIDTKWGGASNLFGGEGGFVIHCTGQGTVVGGCYGALDRHDLAEGQGFTVDSGHLVAYEDQVHIQTRKATKGFMQTLKSGEGLVIDVTGPGSVWTQTRNPHEFLGWLTRELPFQPA
jgi:uncharacterized protein (TIGR00266 family)